MLLRLRNISKLVWQLGYAGLGSDKRSGERIYLETFRNTNWGAIASG